MRQLGRRYRPLLFRNSEMDSMPSTTKPANRTISEADRVRAMKLFLMRRTAALFAKITTAGYTGHMEIRVHAKNGRPGEPVTGDVRQGMFLEE